MPDAIELDESLGREQIFAVFCDRPLDPEALRAALTAHRTPAGCGGDSFTWRKQARP